MARPTGSWLRIGRLVTRILSQPDAWGCPSILVSSPLLAFLMGAANAWVSAFPDDNDFWINHGVGRRVSALIDSILIKSKALFGARSALRLEVDAVLAAMVRAGVAEASRSEARDRGGGGGRQ
jgi:hypothetical protein